MAVEFSYAQARAQARQGDRLSADTWGLLESSVGLAQFLHLLRGTALAQLLLVWVLWPERARLSGGRLAGPVVVLTALVSLQWALGVFSAFKRLIFDDPQLIDRLENIIEWCYALPMATGFIVVA